MSAIILKTNLIVNQKWEISNNSNKFYEGKTNTSLHQNRMLKEGSHCIPLSVKSISSVIKMCKSYYSQMFLEEYKYIAKEKSIRK